MESSLYKDVVTSRGFKYHYYFSPAVPGKFTLLFCHGFPTTSSEWRKIVPYFKEKGYGIIVPDMLGYAGTDKPTDPALYVGSGLTKDITDILDAEKIHKVVAIGHDWGAGLVSRLVNWAPERVIAYAFLAVSYFKPWPKGFTYEELNEQSKEENGYELFGYWKFFNRDDANQIIQDHLESFISVVWPTDPKTWIDRFAITGGLEKSLLEDWTAPTQLNEQDKEEFIKVFRANKFDAPTCWYKTLVRGFAGDDDAKIPQEQLYPPRGTPIFFGAAKEDYVCRPAYEEAVFNDEHFEDGQVTIKEYDEDHWLPEYKAEEVSRDLEAWIKGFTGSF